MSRATSTTAPGLRAGLAGHPLESATRTAACGTGPATIGPNPSRARPPARVPPVQAYTYVGIWIGLSGVVIMYNKYLLAYGGFPYPITLTMWWVLSPHARLLCIEAHDSCCAYAAAPCAQVAAVPRSRARTAVHAGAAYGLLFAKNAP